MILFLSKYCWYYSNQIQLVSYVVSLCLSGLIECLVCKFDIKQGYLDIGIKPEHQIYPGLA